MSQARQQWRHDCEAIAPERLVFLDESWAKTNLSRIYGWGPTDQRVMDDQPHGHWHTTTLLSAIRTSGVLAPFVMEGALDGLAFRTWLERLLVPQLHPGDIVVMDNLAAHKVSGVVEMIEAAGAEAWYLPPYSPDLNPIEKVWSRIKKLLRQAKARSFDHLWRAVGQALGQIRPDELRNYFAKCGYAIAN